MLFAPDSYNIIKWDLHSASSTQSLGDFNQVRPIVALHQLRVQLRIYTGLVSFLQDLLVPSKPDEVIRGLCNKPRSGDHPTLLARCAWESYCCPPDSINLEYLSRLVKASLDEALRDLYRLRESPDSWIARMEGIRGGRSGKTANLLRDTFGRISLFHSLDLLLNSTVKHSWSSAQYGPTDSTLPANYEAFKRLVSVHVAFQHTLNEVLRQIARTKWSAAEYCSGTLFRLLDLLKSNDPSLRVMGIAGVL